MPEDLFYLAMIESGLSNRAVSHASAVGLWQFIAETGRRYGLEVSTYVDERRDPLKSTDAALDYLTDLHDRFGSWYLAAAGYNSGENRVERILRQRAGGQKGDDALYWRIASHLPRETRDYVPLMLAAGHIGKDPNAYGFYGIEHQAPLAFDRVEVGGASAWRRWRKRRAWMCPGAGSESASDPRHDASGPDVGGAGAGGPPDGCWRTWTAWRRRSATNADASGGAGGDHGPCRAPLRGERGRGAGTANPGVNPRRMQVGQSLRVPAGVGAAGELDTPAHVDDLPGASGGHADAHCQAARGHGQNQLRQWNGIGTRIYAGQRLRIRA
jgi:hypothetical protein